MKRTYGRKRFEDLQGVPIGTVEYPTTSCSVMSSGTLANGSDIGSLAPPTARLPPRLVAKDVWPPGPEQGRMRPQSQAQTWNPSRERGSESQTWTTGRERPQEQRWSSSTDRAGHSGQDQSWIPGRDRAHTGQEQAWATGRERGPEQAWSSGRDRAQDQAWNPGREPGRDRPPSGNGQGWGAGRSQDQAWSSASRERGEAQVWRPDSVNMGDLQNSAEHNPAQSSDEQKPLVLPSKKEVPTYPPGSQEERWQLQIVAKGRVTCPKCKSVSRKTVEGLKKHMENCRLQPFSCPHCGKQLKSSTGMKYHVMADHSHLPSLDDTHGLDERAVKDKLRKILKRLGKLKCSREGCTAGFTSIMGYVYHMKKCGKQESELEKLLLNCSHCGKAYKSKAGLEYHLKSEHAPVPQQEEEEEALKAQSEVEPERTASGRVQRASAQVANFHLAEIAHNDLPKDWPKRKFQSDLVPDDKKLKYARPGLPAFSQEVLRKWKNEVKLQRKVQCPNQGCGCTYTSVSGLKAHLGLCTKGDFEAGKYRCLVCGKEFNSESGVKYHINSVHSQEWFVTNKKASKKFEKYLRSRPKELVHGVDQQIIEQYHQHHMNHHHHLHHHHHLQHHPHHLHHHQHDQQLQQIQHQPLQQQQPLQPLHHLQHQAHLLHPGDLQLQHHSVPQMEAQLSQELLQQQPPPPLLHYTPLEPPVGSLWVDVERRGVVAGSGAEQAQVEMEIGAADKPRAEDGGGGGGGRGSEGKRREKAERSEERGKAESRRKDCFAYSGGGVGGGGVAVGGSSSSSSSSSSNTGSSSSESELEQQERQRQIDQWNLKRPGNMDAHPEAAKRQRNT
ncbi:unnamed protein product [Merluccius merluccius]